MFIKDFLGIELNEKALTKVYESADHNSTGMIDKVKMGMFILRISGFAEMAKEKRMPESVMNNES